MTRWTCENEGFIRKNIHLSNAELAKRLGVTQSAVENKVRDLGLARTFSKDEVAALRRIWGRSRAAIERALPRFTWRQISKKANNIGLPPLEDAAECTLLYRIIAALDAPQSMANKWRSAGLRVTNDQGRHMKNSSLLVDFEDFWEFAAAHPNLVEVHKLFTEAAGDVLGVPPDFIQDMRFTAKPVKRRNKHKSLVGARRKELAQMYFLTDTTTEKLAERFGVSVDTARHAACENKEPGQRRSQARVVTADFCRRLSRLFYTEGKTTVECAEILQCSLASVSRGLTRLRAEGKASKVKETASHES
ncbi:hypothetical protein FACS1894208_00790 [Clostridia bacterium]|nr:hypothetical protein FACS1894208_00790 [Clostridia bacterium]